MNTPVLCYSPPINPSHPLMKSAVSRWRVVPWYASGTRWIDLVGKNHGTLTSGPTWLGKNRPGAHGTVVFDGINDFVSVASAPSLQITSTITLAVWVKLTSTGGAVLAAKDSDTNERAYTLDHNGGGNVFRFYLNGGGTVIASSTTAPTAGVWVHLIGTYDGATGRIYVNGKQEGTSAGALSINTGNATFQIGAREYSSARGFIPGQLDDVTLWNRTLSASEAHQLFDATSRPDDPTLNWIRPVRYFGVTAAGGGSNRRRRLLCAGRA